MNAEYAKDIGEVKEQVESLTEDIMDREQKFTSLQTEHKKSLKTIQGLQSYLMTLPAAEEVKLWNFGMFVFINVYNLGSRVEIQVEIQGGGIARCFNPS